LTASEIPRLIAKAHTVFNLTVSLLLMPLIGVLISILKILVPDRGEPATTGYGILEEKFLALPVLALYEAEQEVNRMASIVSEQLVLTKKVFFENDLQATQKLRENENTIDLIHEKAGDYLHSISTLMLNEQDRSKKRALVHAVTDLEQRFGGFTNVLAEGNKQSLRYPALA